MLFISKGVLSASQWGPATYLVEPAAILNSLNPPITSILKFFLDATSIEHSALIGYTAVGIARPGTLGFPRAVAFADADFRVTGFDIL